MKKKAIDRLPGQVNGSHAYIIRKKIGVGRFMSKTRRQYIYIYMYVVKLQK